ncbi:hypothetical protein FRC03_009168 [Tulasnella sp. 419]|nr:hypothetical protein FRC03_009168 [Tulasnella sp. 419]
MADQGGKNPSTKKADGGLPSYTDKDTLRDHTHSHPNPNRDDQTLSVEDYTLFWDQYMKESEAYDKEMVNGITGDLDTLLIFANLFSAINTAFIMDTSRSEAQPCPRNQLPSAEHCGYPQ